MYWFYIDLAVLLALGLLGASSVIVKKKPDAKEALEKLAKYSGYVGAVALLWGIWGVIDAILHLGLLSVVPLLWITWLATSVIFIGLGTIFGFGLASTYVSSESAKIKGEAVRRKLVPYQSLLGFVSLGLVVWWPILYWVIY
jgi:hypothetical protein